MILMTEDEQLEEESYSKVLLIILSILVVIIIIFVFNLMTGGTLIRDVVSVIISVLPFGRFLQGYVGIHGIPI